MKWIKFDTQKEEKSMNQNSLLPKSQNTLEGYSLQLANIEGSVGRIEQTIATIREQMDEMRPLMIDMANFLGMKYPYPKNEQILTTSKDEFPF